MSEETHIDETLDRLVRISLVARALASAELGVSDIVDICVRQGMAGLAATGGIVAFVEPDGSLSVPVMVGLAEEARRAFEQAELHESLPLTDAIRETQAVWVPSRAEAVQRYPSMFARSRKTAQAWAAIPLQANASTIGALGINFSTARDFDEADRLFIRALADVCALALDRKRTQRSAEATMMRHDGRWWCPFCRAVLAIYDDGAPPSFMFDDGGISIIFEGVQVHHCRLRS